MSTISISELEQLRGKMTTEFHEDDIIVCDVGEDSDLYERGLMAEHNAMPALLALARAVVEVHAARIDAAKARNEWSRAMAETRPGWPNCAPDLDTSNPTQDAAYERMSQAESHLAKCQAAYDAARAAVTL